MFTIFYADCAHGSFGDYGAAAEVLYAYNNYCSKHKLDNVCILTSSKSGVDIYKRLFESDKKADSILVYDQRFELIELATFAKDNRIAQHPNYIEVGNCKSPPIELLIEMSPQLRKIMFISLPLYPVARHKQDVAYYYGSIPSFAGKLSRHCLGFGPERLGFPVQSGFIKPINPIDFKNIPTGKYGFARFASVYNNSRHPTTFEQNNHIGFLKGYLLLSNKLYGCRNFVIICKDTELVMKALEGIQATLKSPFHVYMRTTGVEDQYAYASADGKVTKKNINECPTIREANDNALYFWVTDMLPREQLRSLIKDAIPFVATTGLMSYLEALVLNKISLYQYIDVNEFFIEDFFKNIVYTFKPNSVCIS